MANQNATFELSIHCNGLRKADLMSKSDPYCEVLLENISGKMEIVGKTETIKNNHNPEFYTKPKVGSFFGQMHNIEFRVLERALVASLQPAPTQVIALGGAVLSHLPEGRVIHLELDEELNGQRLTKRGLLASLDSTNP